jgi:hypothetical protein
MNVFQAPGIGCDDRRSGFPAGTFVARLDVDVDAHGAAVFEKSTGNLVVEQQRIARHLDSSARCFDNFACTAIQMPRSV